MFVSFKEKAWLLRLLGWNEMTEGGEDGLKRRVNAESRGKWPWTTVTRVYTRLETGESRYDRRPAAHDVIASRWTRNCGGYSTPRWNRLFVMDDDIICESSDAGSWLIIADSKYFLLFFLPWSSFFFKLLTNSFILKGRIRFRALSFFEGKF